MLGLYATRREAAVQLVSALRTLAVATSTFERAICQQEIADSLRVLERRD